MNEWLIDYVHHGQQWKTVWADTIYLALEKFRNDNPEVPALAVYSIQCVQ